jgi:SAM-dependent methyltransferase
MPLGYNKLCEIEDFGDETLSRHARELFPRNADGLMSFQVGQEHRKHWELAQATRALVDFGATHSRAEILGVGAGTESTIFWATNHARRVFATDLYLDDDGWEDTAPVSMLRTPGDHAFCDWNERRLVVQHMNALELRYEDACFDGVFCSSSLEHFGDTEDVHQALGEMWRVLRPGGVATLSTEYRLRGPGPGIPGTLMFDALELDELIVRAFPWKLVEPLDLSMSEQTLATEVRLADAVAGTAPHFPHIVLSEGDVAFTSVHIALRKSGPRASGAGVPAR